MLKTAIESAKSAGEILRYYFSQKREILKFETKEDGSFVSTADRESEEEIKKTILTKYPCHAINGEETGKIGESKITWHVDPLDATTNFRYGFPRSSPHCCISIGAEKDDKFIIGVIYNPFSKQLFSAEEGKKAYCNEDLIYVSEDLLSEGIHLIEGTYRIPERRRNKISYLDQLTNIPNKPCRPRSLGSNALALTEIASGTAVSLFSDADGSWDFAAGAVIAKEAGAVVTDQLGNELTAKSRFVLAANNKSNHDTLVKITRDVYNLSH